MLFPTFPSVVFCFFVCRFFLLIKKEKANMDGMGTHTALSRSFAAVAATIFTSFY